MAKRLTLAFITAALAMLALDAVWLGTMIPRMYQPALGPLLAETPDFLAAGLFYLLYVVGVLVFAVRPLDPHDGWARPALRGALLGLFAYGTYDLTNQATLAGWPGWLSAVDMAWGTVLTASVTLAARFALSRLDKAASR